VEIALDLDEALPLNRGVEHHLFRLLQEAMSNTFRHARASRMEICLRRRGDAVQLLVQDNGVGFDPRAKRQTSYGLTNMEERVNELGGSLQIASAPGKGTRVDIRIPLVKGEAPAGSAADGATPVEAPTAEAAGGEMPAAAPAAKVADGDAPAAPAAKAAVGETPLKAPAGAERTEDGTGGAANAADGAPREGG